MHTHKLNDHTAPSPPSTHRLETIRDLFAQGTLGNTWIACWTLLLHFCSSIAHFQLPLYSTHCLSAFPLECPEHCGRGLKLALRRLICPWQDSSAYMWGCPSRQRPRTPISIPHRYPYVLAGAIRPHQPSPTAGCLNPWG